MEKSTQLLLEISTNPTISVLKGVLERNKKRKQNKNADTNSSGQPTNDDFGFVRGAKYFGGDNK